MRKDLNKQLCERARHGHAKRYGDIRRNRHLDRHFDDQYDIDSEDINAPTYQTGGNREGIKFRHSYHWNRKEFNEHLSPLYGIIRKAVGRKWDDFYSELKENFDTRSVINNHILEHLYDRIAVNGLWYDEDGVLMYRSSYRFNASPVAEDGPEYYVDPKDGIIKFNRQDISYKTIWARRRAEEAEEAHKVRRVIDASTELLLIDNVWYEVKFRENKPTPVYTTRQVHWAYIKHGYKKPQHTIPEVRWEYNYVYDVVKKRKVEDKRYAYEKRTLSHKELKAHGLI